MSTTTSCVGRDVLHICTSVHTILVTETSREACRRVERAGGEKASLCKTSLCPQPDHLEVSAERQGGRENGGDHSQSG